MRGELSTTRQRELEQIANKSRLQVRGVAFVFGPLGYALLGKWALAILCLVTLNWFFTGFIVAPLHVDRIMRSAEAQLDDARAAAEAENGIGGNGTAA